jgi:hypothetical protein
MTANGFEGKNSFIYWNQSDWMDLLKEHDIE